MPGIDELLNAEGERWRHEVDAHRAATRTARPARRLLLWSASVCGAAAAVALVAGLVLHGGNDENVSASSSLARSGQVAAGQGSAAAAPSCAVPVLHVDAGAGRTGSSSPSQAPVRVAAGQRLTVSGVGYGRTDCEHPTPGVGVGVGGAVTLRLVTADGRTRTLVRARPARPGSFRLTITLPADVPAGAAALSDGLGQAVHLTITAR